MAPVLSSWSSWTRLGARHHLLVLSNSSWHLLCPSGPAGIILALIVSSWFSWKHLDVHHLCLVLSKISWHPPSPSAPAGPILVPIISALPCWTCLASVMSYWSSWTLLGVHLLLVLHKPSWHPSSQLDPAGHHLDTHHLLLLLDPSWWLSYSPGLSQPILVPVISAWP